MNEELIEEGRFNEWKAQAESQWLFNVWLPRQIERIKDQWAAGAFTAETQSGTIQLNTEAIGRVTALQQLRDLDYQDIIGDFAADKPEIAGPDPIGEQNG